MEKAVTIIPWNKLTIDLRRIFALSCLCIILLSPFKTNSQTTVAKDKTLYSITTPYEIARKKLVDQAGDEINKIISIQDAMSTYILLCASVTDNDHKGLGEEFAQLESREAIINAYIGVAKLEQFDKGSFEYLYKQLDGRGDGPKARFAKWYINERKRIEKLKTATDKQRYLLRHPPLGSKNKLIKTVSYKFRDWCTKGEFESTIDHHARLHNHATEVFDSICQSEAENICHNGLTIRVNNYNADNEQLTLTLRHGDSDSLTTTQSITTTQARKLVTRIRNGDSCPTANNVQSIGISNGYLYPRYTPLDMGYDSDPFMLNINIPQFSLSYNELIFNDTLIDRFMNGHTYLDQTSFEKKKLLSRVQSNHDLKIAYDRGGLAEVESVLSLLDTANLYAEKYGYNIDSFWPKYKKQGLSAVEKSLQLAKSPRQTPVQSQQSPTNYQEYLAMVNGQQQSQVQDQQQNQEQDQTRQKKERKAKNHLGEP